MFSISKCSMTLVTTRCHATLKLLNSMHKPRGLLGHALSHRCDGVQRHLGLQSFSTTANGRSVLGNPSSSEQAHPDKIDRRSPGLSFDDRTEPTAHFNPATLEPHVKTWLEDPKCYLDGNHIYRGKKSPVAGHIEATYRALWPAYVPSLRWCLIISYDSNCVSDDEDLWLEVKAACDFARAITEGERTMDGEEPGWNLRPLEYIHINSRFHYDLKHPEEPWHISCTVGKRRTSTDGVHLHQGFHVYGTDNSLAEGYHGYRRVLKEEERHPMKPASKSSKTTSERPRLITAIAPEDHQSRDVRTALLRATSMKSVLPPEGTPALDELRPLLKQGDTVQFDDLRRALGEDGSGSRRPYNFLIPPFRTWRQLQASKEANSLLIRLQERNQGPGTTSGNEDH